MNENLPPPNWSPTGNSGYWVWHEKVSYDSRREKWDGEWKWLDDVHGYEKLADYKKRIACGSGIKRKSWIKRLLKL